MLYRTLHTLKVGSVYYGPGSLVELTEADVPRLVALGAIMDPREYEERERVRARRSVGPS